MAVYPTALVTTTDIPAAGANLSTNPHSSLHDEMRDEIVAIEAELGIAPSGSYATLVARLNTGWQHINTATFSAASTVDITITASTYKMVRLHIWGSCSTGPVFLHARVNNDSTAGLHRNIATHIADADAESGVTNTQTEWRIGQWGNSVRGNTLATFMDTDSSNVFGFVSHSAVYNTTGADARAGVLGGNLASARLLSSLRILPATGTITGGYVVEGYRVP